MYGGGGEENALKDDKGERQGEGVRSGNRERVNIAWRELYLSHLWLSHSFRVHLILFQTLLGELIVLPQTL